MFPDRTTIERIQKLKELYAMHYNLFIAICLDKGIKAAEPHSNKMQEIEKELITYLGYSVFKLWANSL